MDVSLNRNTGIEIDVHCADYIDLLMNAQPCLHLQRTCSFHEKKNWRFTNFSSRTVWEEEHTAILVNHCICSMSLHLSRQRKWPKIILQRLFQLSNRDTIVSSSIMSYNWATYHIHVLKKIPRKLLS